MWSASSTSLFVRFKVQKYGNICDVIISSSLSSLNCLPHDKKYRTDPGTASSLLLTAHPVPAGCAGLHPVKFLTVIKAKDEDFTFRH